MTGANGAVITGPTGILYGVKSGAKKPDIKTPDAMKQTLLNAKSVTYAEDGASKPHIEKMFNVLSRNPEIRDDPGAVPLIVYLPAGRFDKRNSP